MTIKNLTPEERNFHDLVFAEALGGLLASKPNGPMNCEAFSALAEHFADKAVERRRACESEAAGE